MPFSPSFPRFCILFEGFHDQVYVEQELTELGFSDEEKESFDYVERKSLGKTEAEAFGSLLDVDYPKNVLVKNEHGSQLFHAFSTLAHQATNCSERGSDRLKTIVLYDIDIKEGPAYNSKIIRERIEGAFRNRSSYIFDLEDETDHGSMVYSRLKLTVKHNNRSYPTRPILLGFKVDFEEQVERVTGVNLKGVTEEKKRTTVEQFRMSPEGRRLHNEIWVPILRRTTT